MKKVFLMIGVLLALTFANTAEVQAQVIVKIRPTRPAVAVVKRPAARRGHIWVDGHWKYNNRRNQYAWTNGYWVKARRGQNYVPGNWVAVSGGHKWVAGRWVRR